MAYSRKALQSRNYMDSCIIVDHENIAIYFGYLKETRKHPFRIPYTTRLLDNEARMFRQEGHSFQEFNDYVSRIYVENPDFVWNPGMKEFFQKNMEKLKRKWK